MLQRKTSPDSEARTPPAAAPGPAMPAVPEGMNPMIGVKLWHNPCRLSFRVNFIAHHFNQPIYDWIARNHHLTEPEHVVLYAIGLREGITAEDVASSSSRPRNTLSRAVNRLLGRKLIFRRHDAGDRRRRLLYLTGSGRAILDETVPLLVAREEALTGSLSAEERETLNYLMTKVILNQAAWPTRIDRRD
jgi:DNA-binding MarR family transcriptional regulator